MSKSVDNEVGQDGEKSTTGAKALGLESSNDSSGDSGSESDSGSNNSQKSGSTGTGSSSSGSGELSDSPNDDNESVESDNGDDHDPEAPAAALVPESNIIDLNASSNVVKDHDNDNMASESGSPVFATPAKSIILPASPRSLNPFVTPKTTNNQSTTPVTDGPSNEAEVKVETKEDGKLTSKQELDPTKAKGARIEPTRSDKPKTSGKSKDKVKAKKGNKKDQLTEKQKDSKYRKQVRKLEAALKRAEKGLQAKEVPKKKPGDKQPVVKKSNSVNPSKVDSPTQSTDETDSSDSSCSEEPAVLPRIGKIPDGRRFQRLAMSRSKEIGVIRDGTIRPLELSIALKAILSAQFNIFPTHAYKQFYSIPGTRLPHIRRHLRDLCQRYSALARSIANLHLLFAKQQNASRKQLVLMENENAFAPVWQFENDLNRAPSTSTQRDNVSDHQLEPPLAKKPKLKTSDHELKTPSKPPKKPKTKSKTKKASSESERKHKHGGSKSKSGKKKKNKKDKDCWSEVLNSLM